MAFLLKPVKYQKALTVLFVWLLLKVSADQGVRTVTSLAVPFYGSDQAEVVIDSSGPARRDSKRAYA